MTTEITGTTYDLELDLRGLGCPMTMLKLAADLDRVDVGGVIKVLSSDPACRYDIPAWGRVSGNEVLSVEEHEGTTTLMVRRLK